MPRVIAFFVAFLCLLDLLAQQDSLRTYRIQEVYVSGSLDPSGKRSATPLQRLDGAMLSSINSLLVSDATRFFSGAVIKDYGGIGGMKTLSVRSMGAQHTAVSYDGVTLSDAQTGQIDLGRFALNSIEVLQLTIGDGNDIFQPARQYASSGMLSMQSKRPFFQNGERVHGDASMQVGSFGLMHPHLNLAVRLHPNWSATVSTEYLKSEGNYPFELEGEDSVSTQVRRKHNAVENKRIELGLWSQWQGWKWDSKWYHFDSSKELPGAVILYNSSSEQYLWDKQEFVQMHLQSPALGRLDFKTSLKYNDADQRYLNNQYLGASGKEEVQYAQQEVYASLVGRYRLHPKLHVSLAHDEVHQTMQSTLQGFAEPKRRSGYTHAAVKLMQDRFLATAGVLLTQVDEAATYAQAAQDLSRWSPSLSTSWQLFPQQNLFLRAFYKASFRMPSFNDLYYTNSGNRNLKPEDSKQWNVGLTVEQPLKGVLTVFSAQVDVFHNRIRDKIMAIPTKNVFVWSMVNLGSVDIKGLDATLHVDAAPGKHRIGLTWTHSYQRALDQTRADDAVYNNQIAYAPRIYGSGRMDWHLGSWSLDYTLLYSGHRYVTGHNLEENRLPGYVDQGLGLEHAFDLKKATLRLKGELLNMNHASYEIVRNFPMPGRSFRLMCTYQW